MPTSLQGLNLVYPPLPPSENSSQDLLLPPPGFSDLSAQLDLWTNLSFASDEPFIPTKDRKQRELIVDQKLQDDNETEDLPEIHDPRLIASDKQTSVDNPLPLPNSSDQSSFDLGTFLAGFGIDPFLVPPQTTLPNTTPSTSNSSPTDNATYSTLSQDVDGQPANKRTRTRKASNASAIAPSALQQPHAVANDVRAVSEFSDDHDPLTTPLNATEDKRRRNTAASARFRAKKKEREQALEKRSKELESKVTELERECEGLRRENGWLKGLVVGVTGGNPSGVSSVPADGSGDSSEANRGKRKREAEGSSGLDG